MFSDDVWVARISKMMLSSKRRAHFHIFTIAVSMSTVVSKCDPFLIKKGHQCDQKGLAKHTHISTTFLPQFVAILTSKQEAAQLTHIPLKPHFWPNPDQATHPKLIGQHFVELWIHVHQFLYPRGCATDILAVPDHAASIDWSRNFDQISQASVLCTTMASPWLIAI